MQRIVRLFALPTLAVMSACSTVATPAQEVAAAPAATAEHITFTISSWGQPQRVWTLDTDGRLLVETKAEGQPYHSYDLDQRRAALSSAQIAEVRLALEAARSAPPRCTVVITDGPSVFIDWTSGGAPHHANIYMGCAEPEFRPILQSAFAADAIVSQAVDGVAISGRRHIGP